MTRTHAVALVAALLIAGCASSEPAEDEVATSKGAPTPGQEIFPVVASSERVVGENRFQIGLLDTNDAPIRSPKTTLHVGFVGPGDEAPSSTSTMKFVWTIKPVQGLWVGEATFDEAGQWEAVIDVQGGGYDATVGTTFDVKEEGTTPEIGDKGPAVETPTLADVGDLSEITTDSNPSRRFYELSIAEALKAGRPAVIVFATPKFCTSQVCGPTLSIVKDVAKDYPGVNFVHVEPYDLDKVPEELDPVPAVTAWGLPSEPWVFVTDERGRVAAKYEGSVAPRELRPLLRQL
ncbi:MAG: hypothetical protein M3277_12665 [Actinomycetota bacterium]|nr:hypothetical protein [Actinomycetota bacterium]